MGTAWVVTAPQRAALRWLVAVALLAASLPFAVPRAQWLGEQLAFATDRGRLETDLDRAIAQAGGREALLSCGALAIESRPLTVDARPALAWQLDVPLARVRLRLDALPGVVVAHNDGAAAPPKRGRSPAPVAGSCTRCGAPVRRPSEVTVR
jgi:hypothetical protein